MARRIMGGDFRAISKAKPVAIEVEPDPRLALVDLFRGSEVFRPDGTIDLAAPLPGGFVDLSGEGPDYAALSAEDSYSVVGDSQEPAEQPEPDADDSGPQDAPEPAHEEPARPEPVEKVDAPVQDRATADYDPIAAVLG